MVEWIIEAQCTEEMVNILKKEKKKKYFKYKNYRKLKKKKKDNIRL